MAKINRGWVTLGQNFRVFPLENTPVVWVCREREHPMLTMVKLFWKYSNLCDHNPPTLQTDRRHAIARPRFALKLFIFAMVKIALLLCERQQNWLMVVAVVFRTIGICYYFYVLRFFTFFQIQKVVTFYVFLPCFVRFLELWVKLTRRLQMNFVVYSVA